MADWIYFVLAAYAIWAVCSLIDKIVISKGYIKNPLVYIVLNGLMNVLIVFLFPFVEFELLSFTDILIVMLIAGVLFVISVVLYYKAVEHDEISRIIMIYQLSPVFTFIFSYIILGERLGKSQIIGFLFLLAAGLIVSYKKVGKSIKISKAFYYILASAFLGSVGAVSVKYIYNVTNFWNAFLWLRISGFTALGVLAAASVRNEFVGTFKNMNPKIRYLLGFKMVIDFSAFAFIGYAIYKGPLSLVSALSGSVHPLFVFALALIATLYIPHLLKEEINKKSILSKLLALALIIIGIIFVNL